MKEDVVPHPTLAGPSVGGGRRRTAHWSSTRLRLKRIKVGVRLVRCACAIILRSVATGVSGPMVRRPPVAQPPVAGTVVAFARQTMPEIDRTRQDRPDLCVANGAPIPCRNGVRTQAGPKPVGATLVGKQLINRPHQATLSSNGNLPIEIRLQEAGMSGLMALFDDEAAVTPKYMQGFSPARELPMVWRIARASLINKLVFLLPAGLALSAFAPWLIPPLLMLGGGYLCFEGAEKVAHFLGFGKGHGGPDGSHTEGDAAHLEEEKVAGAIKTDFILSAEIMTIALAALPESGLWMEAATLAMVAVGITALVYGAVALIVKADDVGLYMAGNGRLGLTRALGRGIVHAMPMFMKLLMIVGTTAMLWVGGSIILHALDQMGFPAMYDFIHHVAITVARGTGGWQGAVEWAVTAGLDGLFGLVLGLALIPVGVKVIKPVWTRLTPAP